jgi:hypothetical protein
MYSLRFRNCFPFFASRYARAARHTLAHRARSICAAMFHPCTLVLALAWDNYAAIIARAIRTPTTITFAECPNVCLYQFGSRSVQPFGRQRLICSAARKFARSACMNAHSRSATPVNCADCPNERVYQFGSRSVQSFGRQPWICSVACKIARAVRT